MGTANGAAEAGKEEDGTATHQRASTGEVLAGVARKAQSNQTNKGNRMTEIYDDESPVLPNSVLIIAEKIGETAALKLVSVGRRWVHVPTINRLRPHHWIRIAIGDKHAEILSHEFGGLTLYLSGCAQYQAAWRRRAVAGLLSQGLPVRTVAEWIGHTDRHIRNIRAELSLEETYQPNQSIATCQPMKTPTCTQH